MRIRIDKRSLAERALVEAFMMTRSEILFRRLYRAHAPRMLRLAGRLTRGSSAMPDDVVQEAWIRAVSALNRFEWRSSLSSWLGGFVVNVVREQRRVRSTASVESGEETAAEHDDPLTRLDVAQALEQLPSGYRAVITLHDLRGFTHEEIAGILGIAIGTSKSQLARARRTLRALLEREKE